MASIVERPARSGEITYQVKWREGGGRGAPGQSEKFGDRPSAEQFKNLVDAHGQQWPPGWVRGKGFVEPDAHPDDVPWLTWANRYVDRLTGIDDRTRDDYRRDIRIHLSLLQHTERSGHVQPATICNITQEDVQDWVRAEEKGEPDPDAPDKWLRRQADPKSIRNRHGLMFCIDREAGEERGQRPAGRDLDSPGASVHCGGARRTTRQGRPRRDERPGWGRWHGREERPDLP